MARTGECHVEGRGAGAGPESKRCRYAVRMREPECRPGDILLLGVELARLPAMASIVDDEDGHLLRFPVALLGMAPEDGEVRHGGESALAADEGVVQPAAFEVVPERYPGKGTGRSEPSRLDADGHDVALTLARERRGS